ncbi:RP-L9 [Acanthosepion pharaonis]|uniref:Large ribosomal subunit protein bL9m n=1 Tax=Acanthosepion pharaonis TaxID=158019 RepID=A0A812DM45_ACAPH|nr:RP-L9 [Sepia pharaonis]
MSTKMALNILRNIPQFSSKLSASKWLPLLLQNRNTVILKRKWPVLFAKEGRVPILKYKNKVYELEENTCATKLPDIECILTQDIDGIGYKHELVSVKRKLFRKILYPAGMAMYASPENIKEFLSGEKPKRLGSPWARIAMDTLSTMFLVIPMSGDTPWTLTAKHIKVAFRLVGVEITEEAILLPEEPITEPQELEFQVTMNGMENVTVKSLILLKHKDATKDTIPPNLPPTFRETSKKKLWAS